jgi:hypothetical protein
MMSAFVGMYQMPGISKIKPKYKNTSIHKIAINVALILLLSSSFPVVARILGNDMIHRLISSSRKNFSSNNDELTLTIYESILYLGLTSFDLIGYYSTAKYLKNDLLHVAFSAAFMFVMSQQYMKVFPPTYYAYRMARLHFESVIDI